MSVAPPPVPPQGIPSAEMERVWFVPTIADPKAPKLTEITAVGAVDITCLLADFGMSADDATGEDKRLCSAQAATIFGAVKWALEDFVYAWDPQGTLTATSPDLNKLGALAKRGTTGYIVYLVGKPVGEAPAAGDKVYVFPIRFGTQVPQKPVANEVLRATNAVAITGPVQELVALAA